ncbi:MAG: efflux RND transporter periplasmic adaptor subunit [Acidobacteriota bacterium]|nr:efflux RND transporter periplasmic adaptor subunit [Acidobacteriota bacterium]
MTRRRALAAAASAAALVLLLASVRAVDRRLDPASGLPVVTLTRGPFARRVKAEGNLKAMKATPLVAPGRDISLKIAWLADDGSPVRKGDVVVRFDSTQTEKNLLGGRADRRTNVAKTTKTNVESGAAIRNLDRDGRQSHRELESARTFQSKDPEIFSRHAIIEADIDASLAGSREENAYGTKAKKERLADADRDLLGIDRRKADFKVSRAEKEMTALAIVAPHDGFLVFQRDWRGELPSIGQVIWSGYKVAEIPDVSALAAEVWVLEADAGGLAAGRPATVVVESDPDTVWPGRIERVDSVPKPRVKGVPVQYFGVTVVLDRVDALKMKPGQRVEASLALDAREDALAVPRQAVFERDGKKIVYRRKGRTFEPVEVALGPVALGTVVVEKGLASGDVVALRDPARSADDGPRPKAAPVGGSAR